MDNGDTGFPQMGEVGCGSRYPTCSFINFLQCLSFDAFFASFLISWKAFGASCRKGKEERGIMSLQICASTSAVPVTKVKNQRLNITKRWWERQCKNFKNWKNFILRNILKFYMQRTNFSLDLGNDIRSNHALKDRYKYEYWKLGSISWALQKLKRRVEKQVWRWTFGVRSLCVFPLGKNPTL